MNNIDREEYRSKAATLVEYFKYNVDNEGSGWSYGLMMATKWQKLLLNSEVQKTEINELLHELKNPPEQQGSAYDELVYFISLWATKLK